jgi:hypothetical protein
MPNTLHVQCPGCREFALTGNHADPDSALDGQCRCCTADHDHAAAARACPGAPCPRDHDPAETGCPGVHAGAVSIHAGEPCPFPPGECPVYGGGHTAPTGDPADPSGYMVTGNCPGGHCGKGVKGCTVCRPLTITALKGSFGTLQPAPIGA